MLVRVCCLGQEDLGTLMRRTRVCRNALFQFKNFNKRCVHIKENVGNN